MPPKNLVAWAHRLIVKGAADLDRRIQCSPLYGTLEQREQDDVIKAPAPGWRKARGACELAASS